MGITFSILGPVQVTTDGEDVTPSSRLQRTLMTIFLLYPNRVLSLGRVTELLWDRPPASASANLRTHLSAVRRTARADGFERLDRHGGGYRLALRPDESDLQRFMNLVASGRAQIAAGHTDPGAAELRRALNLWTGRAGSCLDAEGELSEHLSSLDLEKVQVFEEWVDARLRLGDTMTIATAIRGHLAENPTRERAWGQLMQAAYHAGDVSAALVAFNQARRLLTSQLGIEPGRHLQSLQSAILARDETTLERQRTQGFRFVGLAA